MAYNGAGIIIMFFTAIVIKIYMLAGKVVFCIGH